MINHWLNAKAERECNTPAKWTRMDMTVPPTRKELSQFMAEHWVKVKQKACERRWTRMEMKGGDAGGQFFGYKAGYWINKAKEERERNGLQAGQ